MKGQTPALAPALFLSVAAMSLAVLSPLLGCLYIAFIGTLCIRPLCHVPCFCLPWLAILPSLCSILLSVLCFTHTCNEIYTILLSSFFLLSVYCCNIIAGCSVSSSVASAKHHSHNHTFLHQLLQQAFGSTDNGTSSTQTHRARGCVEPGSGPRLGKH